MSFLIINGLEVPCAVDGAAMRKVEQIGQSQRAVDGTLRIHRRVLKNTWSLETTLLDPLQGDAFRRLILGEGHSWTFDDTTKGLYSSKGLGPSASSGASVTAGSAFLGAGKLQQTATTGTITYPALPLLSGQAWTVMVARHIGVSWTHYIVTSTSKAANEAWVDGVYGSNATAWLTVNTAAGTVKLDAQSGATTLYDELIILPFRIPQDAEAAASPWGLQLFNWQNPGLGGGAKQWAPLARLKASGDALYPDHQANGWVVVAGKVEDSDFTIGRWDSAWGLRSDLKSVKFSLEEV